MSPPSEQKDVVIVGAGWAGLSVSYALGHTGLDHVVFERARICETWRTQRWNSFHMNTPNVLTALPGDRYEGPDPEGYMTRDDFVAMVADYARRNALPVREGTAVLGAKRRGEAIEVRTSAGVVRAKAIVVASGNLNVPRRPAVAQRLPAVVVQMDACDYRDPKGLREGAVLVVGCGNSGGQIAEDLVRGGRRVYLSTGRNGRVPRTYRGRDIFVWLTETGRMAMPRTSATGRGLIGATHTISLQSLSAQGVTLVGRLSGISASGVLSFEDNVADSAAYGDAMSEMLRREIDQHIARHGIVVAEAVPDPAETVAPRFPDPPVTVLDTAAEGIATVIWSTGFRGDFRWLEIDGALTERGDPVQDRCISVPGVYFAGLDTLASLRSGTVLSAVEDADRIVRHIVENIR